MNKVITACAVVFCVAAIALATPQSASLTDVEPNAAVGRFTIDKESWEAPILLDTATGDMWRLQESTRLVDARMVAWTPMTRISTDAELKNWEAEARTLEKRYLARLKAQSLAELERKKSRLGVDHPEVIEDQRMIEQLSLYQGVTDDEVEIARKELHDAGVEAP